MSSLGRCLVVMVTTSLLIVVVRSAQARKDTCMSRWLTLSGISWKSVPAYEMSLKALELDESNYHYPLKKKIIPYLLHRHPSDEKKFLRCIEKRLRKCQLHAPCGVGGTCLLKAKTEYFCNCSTGYTGRFCQKDVDECSRGLHKCSKNARCVNNRGSYTCRCKPGYSGNGQQCKEVDECKSQPCANKGTCHNHINKFTCTCKPGFKGKTCNQDINECLSNPCKNNGTCFNKVNAFTCHCPVMYEGTMCEKRWFSGQLFENITKEHSHLLGKVTQLEKKLLRQSAVVENQLSSISKKLEAVLDRQLPWKSKGHPAQSCLAIKKIYGQSRDGFYWIKPPRYSGPAYRAYCDMTTQGGGWTLFATKVSPTFSFPATSFSPTSASSTTSNAKGCILPGTQWSEVLFRLDLNRGLNEE